MRNLRRAASVAAAILLMACGAGAAGTANDEGRMVKNETATQEAEVKVGAARTEQYLPKLRGKRVALFSNHTGMVGDRHTPDVLLDSGINVVTIFSPEHGFRGTADAGEHVGSSVDEPTGVPISSLYDGGKRGPKKEVMDAIDVIVVDIQDVGLRYYTYYCTMIDLMNAAAEAGKGVMVLDRPNPNGMTVDGPILDMKYASGVGRLPIPVVHGMTLAELALMANGEGWLRNGAKLRRPTCAPCAPSISTPRHATSRPRPSAWDAAPTCHSRCTATPT